MVPSLFEALKFCCNHLVNIHKNSTLINKIHFAGDTGVIHELKKSLYCILPFLQLFRKLILACLNQAMKDKAKSVCFPTIGTGYLMYPPDVSARNMLQAITEFGSNNPTTAITIYIVLHRKEESLRKNLRVCVCI